MVELGSNILSTEIQQTFHKELDFKYSIDGMAERCFLGVSDGRCGLYFDFPESIGMCRNRQLCLRIDLVVA